MNQTTKSKAVIGVVLVVIILVVVILLPKKQDATTVLATKETSGTGDSSTQSVSTSSTTNAGAPEKSIYKDGTYTATGSYDSPAGPESIDVTVTLKNGIIESSNVVSEAQDAHSQSYQERFIANYAQFVNGRNIDEVNVGIVSGSSLTPEGFNNALAAIKAEASA